MPLDDALSFNRNRAQRAAAEVVTSISRPPVPIREIVEQAGLDVRFVRFSSLSREVAGFTDFAERAIYVNSADAFNRQTFTIAHEFGHWKLHRELFQHEPEKYQVLLRRATGRNTNPLEKEANTFAANVLVPAKLLRPVKDIASVSELARMFAVSEQVIELRLRYV